MVARRVVEHEVVDDWRTGSIASQASVRCKPARSDHWSSAGAIGSPEPFRVQRFALLHERTIAAPKKERNPRTLEIRLNQAVHRVSRCRSSTRIPVRMVPSVSRGRHGPPFLGLRQPYVCALPFLLGAVLVPSSAPHAVEVFTSPQVAFTEGGLSVLGRFNGRNSQRGSVSVGADGHRRRARAPYEYHRVSHMPR